MTSVLGLCPAISSGYGPGGGAPEEGSSPASEIQAD